MLTGQHTEQKVSEIIVVQRSKDLLKRKSQKLRTV